MKARLRRGAATGLVMLVPACLAAQGQVAGDTVLARLTAEALRASPALAARAAAAQAARLRARAAGALPDPQLGLGVMDLALPRFAFRESDFTEVDAELSQEFPWPGSLGAKARAARAEARARQADTGAERREIAVRVADHYYRLRYVVTARQTLSRQRALLESAVEIATTRYATGAAPQSDPLQARVARARLDAEAAALGAEETELRARLKALRSVSGPDSVPAEPLPSGEALLDQPAAAPASGATAGPNPLAEHPRLRARRLMLEAAEHTIDAERLAGRPGFALTARYGARPLGSDFFSAFIGLRLPVWAGRKQHRLADAARADVEAARAALAEEQLALDTEVEATRAQVAAGATRLDVLTRQVLPSIEASVDAAIRSYRVGQTDFLNLLAVEDALHRTRLEIASVTAEHLTRFIMLEQLTAPEDTQ